MSVQFGNVSEDYAKYRDALPDVLFEQLAERGIRFNDANVLDLGAGSGIFCRQLVEQGAKVTGVEPSRSMIEAAKALDQEAGIAGSIRYVEEAAEAIELPDRYDAVTAVRAWHWFERDKVLEQIKKQLVPNGLLVIINSVFLGSSDVAQITFDVVRNLGIPMNPPGSYAEAKERRNGFSAGWFEEWERSSFRLLAEWQHEYTVPYSHEQWCGKIRSVSWMTGCSDEVRNKMTEELLRRLSGQDAIMQVPHQYSVVALQSI